jgi:hypothetical protein
MTSALLVEFDTTGNLVAAVRRVRELGLTDVDAYTPYSTEEVRDALGHERSRLPSFVYGGGLLGAGGAYALEWYTTAHLYPLDVGGRPPHMPLAYVPISFEMGVLAASVTAFFGVLVLGKLVKLWDPVFEVPGFEGASIDRFWLRVDAPRAAFEEKALRAELDRFQPLRYVVLEEP